MQFRSLVMRPNLVEASGQMVGREGASGSESEGETGLAWDSPITGFYRDRSVFITGATGFMGKVGGKECG